MEHRLASQVSALPTADTGADLVVLSELTRASEYVPWCAYGEDFDNIHGIS